MFSCSLAFLSKQCPLQGSWRLKPSPSPRLHYKEQSASVLHTPCNFNALSVSKDTKNNQSATIPRCRSGALRGSLCLCPSLGQCSDHITLVSWSSTSTLCHPWPCQVLHPSHMHSGAAHCCRDKLHPSRALSSSKTGQKLKTVTGHTPG